MPLIDWATAGTATVKLTILEQPEGNSERSSHIQIPGCFLKNDRNLQHFVEKFIDDSADRNKFDPVNSKYIFYSPVSDFKGNVTKAVLSYEKISKSRNILKQKTKTCTVENPLVIRFDVHFFLCCDSEDLNKSTFLEEYSKEVRNNQTLDPSKSFRGLGMEYDNLLFIPFRMNEGQSQNDIYETNDRRVYNKLKEAGPLLLNNNKTIVGCYRKCNGDCSIKINMFRKNQGAIEHQEQTRLPFLYDQLKLATTRHLNDYIQNGRGTLDELKYRFRVETEREEIDTVEKLVKALENKGGIGANDVEILKMLEELEAECSGDVTRRSTAIHLRTVLKVLGGAGLFSAVVILMEMYATNREKLQNLFPYSWGQLVGVQRGSVVFVLKVSGVSSLKRLWQSYEDGSLKEKLKKSFNEMEELKEVSQGEEIDVEVTIDEGEYRELLFDLILIEVKGRMYSSQNIKRRHSVCCERDVPKNKQMDVEGKSVKDAKSQRRHSVCCERDDPEDRSQLIDVTQIQTQEGQPVTELEKSEKRIKPYLQYSSNAYGLLATAGTATVELTILEKPEGNLERSSHIQIQGCFIKNDRNLENFVEKFIDDSADRNKFDSVNSKYIFYSPVSDFKGDVTEAVLSYEKISKKHNMPQQKTKTCTVENPLVITFDGHFFLCCDSEDLNKSKFLEEYSKEVRINQTLDPSKRFYGLGMEDDYLQFISFNMNEGQSQKDIIYETNDRRVYNKLKEAGPILLNNNKTVVGCYRKCACNGDCRIKINMFGKSQGDPAPDSSPPGPTERDRTPTLPLPDPTERDRTPTLPPPGPPERHQTPTLPPPSPTERYRPLPGITVKYRRPPGLAQANLIEENWESDPNVPFLYDQLMFETIRYLDDYIKKGRGTLDELKDRFRGPLSQLTENEREEVDTVEKLVDALEDRGGIGANDVEILKMLAETLELRELKEKVEKFEAECSGKVTRGSTAIRLKTVLSVLGAELALVGVTLMYIYATNPERLIEILQQFVDLI